MQGDLVAISNLGSLYAMGQGVEVNYEEAVKYFRIAAKDGHPMAQVKLGNMYALGLGVKTDYVEGLAWYKVAHEVPEAETMIEAMISKMPPDDIAIAETRASEISLSIKE